MKAKRYTEEQIIAVLKQAEAGARTKELCRKYGPCRFESGSGQIPTTCDMIPRGLAVYRKWLFSLWKVAFEVSGVLLAPARRRRRSQRTAQNRAGRFH